MTIFAQYCVPPMYQNKRRKESKQKAQENSGLLLKLQRLLVPLAVSFDVSL